MSTPASDPRRADAVRNRRRALEATKALLAEPGATITVEAIARKAGMGVATVARSFGNKDALVDAAVADLLEPLVQRCRDALSEPSTERAMRGLLVEVMAFQSAHQLIGEQPGVLDLPATTAQRAVLRETLHELIARARADGTIRTDIDPAVTTILLGEVTYAVARSRAASPELAKSYITVILDGLRPQP